MGLNERRKVKELQESILPGRVKEIEEICGKGIPYEVDWASIQDDGEALNFLDNLSCHRLNMALRMICMDDIGKEAVRDAPTLVRLETVNDNSELQISFTGGVPEMHYNYARTDCMYGGWRDSRAAEDDSSGDTRLSP